jgi:23S rRNA G2445 N2-methylase RlmL
MPQFIATTARGLVEVLENELHSFGIEQTEKINGGVVFESNWEGCYYVNLHSQIASRVLKPVLDFPAYNGDDIYNNLMKHDFSKYIDPDQTLKVEASLKECALIDQRFLAMKTKDAIVDQYRTKYDKRPDVENFNPDFRVFIKGYKNNYSVAIDTSGDSLFMRGYRLVAGDAPLKENLAAGLLALAEWTPDKPLIDPLCGSGTILIEAAIKASKIAPGSMRKRFGFQNLKNFQEDVWEKLVQEAMDQEIETPEVFLYGSDIDKKVLMAAKANARRAGVDHIIKFKSESVSTFSPSEDILGKKGFIVTNPPYGARIGDEDNLKDVYRDLAHSLKVHFKGWTAWILSGNKDLILELKLKTTRKHFVYNGNIECRFLKYEINEK